MIAISIWPDPVESGQVEILSDHKGRLLEWQVGPSHVAKAALFLQSLEQVINVVNLSLKQATSLTARALGWDV